MIERGARLAILVSVGAALALLATLAARGWDQLPLLTAVVFLAAVCLGTTSDALGVALVLLFAFIVPGAVLAAHGRYANEYSVIWRVALFGAMAPRLVHSGWSLPRRWRPALILWASTIAVSWPIVAVREIDGHLSLLQNTVLSNSSTGGSPPTTIIFVVSVASALGLGILWFDWLFGAFGGSLARFRRFVLAPLAASWLVASIGAAYQLFGDLLFLNTGIFGGTGRASGTMLDANAFGTMEALATAAILAWTLSVERPRWWAAAPLFGLAWLGVWGSGSRTSLLLALAPIVAVAWRLIVPSRSAERRLSRGRVVAVMAAGLLVVAAITALDLPAVGAVRRIRALLPDASAQSAGRFAHELWNRNGYGAVADAMVGRHPLVGVGVGTFYIMVGDYSQAAGLTRKLPTDNAQNWYRHQLAEFGLLGSIGWMAWTALFGWFVLRVECPPHAEAAAGILRAALVGLAVISLVGMPTQNAAVALVFWTFAFWFTSILGPGDLRESASTRTAATWIGLTVVLVLFAAGTWYAAGHGLRPAERALANRWPYSYGFSTPEHGPGGLVYRWAGKTAVAVVRADKRWVRVIALVNHFDIASRPVHAKIWSGTRLVLDTTLRTTAPVMTYARVPEGQAGIVLQTWVDRVVRPRDYGVPDGRDLGLFVHWDFVEAPPESAGVTSP